MDILYKYEVTMALLLPVFEATVKVNIYNLKIVQSDKPKVSFLSL